MGIILLRSLASTLKQILADAASDIIPNPQQQQLSSQMLSTLPPGIPVLAAKEEAWRFREPNPTQTLIPGWRCPESNPIIHCQSSRRNP